MFREIKNLAVFAAAYSDPAAILGANLAIQMQSGSVEKSAIPVVAHALLYGEVQMFDSNNEFLKKVLSRARAMLYLLATHRTPEDERTPARMVTDYPDNPMSDKTRSQWAEWRKKHGVPYVGPRFVPPSNVKRDNQYGVPLRASRPV